MKKEIAILIKSIFLALMLMNNGFAQPSVKVDHYSTEDGLSHDLITCMFKDSEGFMWFGTWNGINRFDGHTFTTFTSVAGDKAQIKNGRIDQIIEDSAHHLWIKCYDGEVYRFDKGTEQFTALSTILKLPKKISFDRILSASDGVLWVSTVDRGIIAVADARGEYANYHSFSRLNKNGFKLPSDSVNFFYKDGRGTFWVGTTKGLSRISKNKQGIFISSALYFPDHLSKDICSVAGNAQKLFFGTGSGDLHIYDRKTGRSSTLSLSKARLNDALVGASGKLYLTSALGELIIFDTMTLTFTTARYPPGTKLNKIFQDRTGNMWIEPEKKGVIRFDVNNRKFETFTQKNDGNNVPPNHFKVFEDKNGTVWAVLRDGGFGYYDQAASRFNYFCNEPGSATRRFSNLVSVAFYDPSGVMWLHTDQRGLEKVIFYRNDFRQTLLVPTAMFKSQNEVRGLLCDRKNRLWIGAKSGSLYVFQDQRKVRISFSNLPKNGFGAVYTIIQDRNDAIWLGTKENGLFKAEPMNKEETSYQLFHYSHSPTDESSISSNQIYSVLEDKIGRIWAGTFDRGLNLLTAVNGKAGFRHFYDGQNGYPLRFHKIRTLAIDGGGKLWIGTTDGLVIAQSRPGNKISFKTYVKQPGNINSLGNNDIQSIFKDHSDDMWLATSGGGLNLAITDPRTGVLTFKSFTTKNGLGNNYVLSLREDNLHNLWMATQSGLSKFSLKQEKFHNFNSYDGVPNDGFSEASAVRMLDDKLIFGTIKGFLSFDPSKIMYHPIHANMVFTNLQINNEDVRIDTQQEILQKSINYADEIKLRYNQNIISIDYSVLDYRSVNRQTYFYRLAGFDTTWHDNKNQLRASYTNLPPGEYEFQLKSPDPESYRNVPEKKLKITILPPPWKTWWAYVIYAAVLTVAIEIGRRIAITVLRLRNGIAVEHKMTALKMAFFTNVSHELRTPLTLILNPITEILNREQLTEQGRDYAAIVKRNASRMVRFVNQLLDLRKAQSGQSKLYPSRVVLGTFIEDVTGYFKETAKINQVRVSILGDIGLEVVLDRDKMETVLYNLLSNAFKFSPSGNNIEISINHSHRLGFIDITINDEGCGVPEKDLENIFQLYHESVHAASQNLKGTGIGLALAREFVELHGGEITASNRENGGLSVTLQLPLQLDEGSSSERDSYLAKGDVPSAENIGVFISAGNVEDSNGQQLGPDLKLVLLVEDNDDLRRILSASLKSVYRVKTASNGIEGLALAKKIHPDIILSDVMMPEMDGIEMLDKLKNDMDTSHIPVILLSAKTAIESQILGLNYGADYYISKPFDNEFLFAAIASIVAQRKRIVACLVSKQKPVDLSPGQIMVTSQDEVFLKKVIEIIEEKMTDPKFNIDTVAESVNMARATFFKKFKSLTQQAPVEFVRDIRLKIAKQHLDAGSGNITEISYQVGFTSPKYFSTCFKSVYGISPSDYLKSTNTKLKK